MNKRFVEIDEETLERLEKVAEANRLCALALSKALERMLYALH